MSALSASLTAANVLVSLPWCMAQWVTESAKGGELGWAVSQISSAMAPSISYGPSLQILLWKNWIKNKSCVCTYFEGGKRATGTDSRPNVPLGHAAAWWASACCPSRPAWELCHPGCSALPFTCPGRGEGSGELGIFVDNVAPKTNVYRDCFSAVKGRVRTGQACAQTRECFWFWMVEGRKEHTAPSTVATYLFNPIVISISLDVWKHPQWFL